MFKPSPQRFAALVVLAAFLAACAPRTAFRPSLPASPPVASPPSSATDFLALPAGTFAEPTGPELLADLNQARQGGVACPDGVRPPVSPLIYHPVLADAALAQAALMAETGRVTHAGADGSTPKARVAARGVSPASVSEVIYLSASSLPGDALRWWLSSSVHCAVLTDARYVNVGAGVARGPGGTAYVVVLSGPDRR